MPSPAEDFDAGEAALESGLWELDDHSEGVPLAGPRPDQWDQYESEQVPEDEAPVDPGIGRGGFGRNTGVLAAGTFLSRLSGFARVAVAVWILGATSVADAYNLANTIPNIIYDLLIGGILSATLIPVFVDELSRRNRVERDRAINAIFSAAAVVLVVISAALYLAAPGVIHLYLLLQPAGTASAQKLDIGIKLLRYFAPQVFFLGLIVTSTALLNARRQFAAAAFSPILQNLVAIAALIATNEILPDMSPGRFEHDHRGLIVLGLGTTLGYLVQLVAQMPSMLRGGIRWRPVLAIWHPAVRKLLGLSAWLFGVVIANQISFNLIAVLANSLPKGQYSDYTYAYQFFQLPYALLAVSVASAIMPDLAQRWSDQRRTAFLSRVISGTRVTFALLVPAGVGYAFVSDGVVRLALEHGHMNGSNSGLIGSTLIIFALGLPGFSVFLPLLRALQAMKEVKAMFVIYAIENLLTIALAVATYQHFGIKGLAFSFVAPYTVAAIITAAYLHRKVGALGGIYTGRSLSRVLLATAAMTLALWGLDQILPSSGGDAMTLVRLVAQVVVGGAVYVGAVVALGVSDLEPFLGPFLRRLAPRPDPEDDDESLISAP